MKCTRPRHFLGLEKIVYAILPAAVPVASIFSTANQLGARLLWKMNSFIYFLPIFLFCDLVFSESLQTDNGCVSSAESLQDASVLPKSSLNINLPDAMNYHHNEYENFGNKSYSKNEAAVYALMSACMVGLSGIAPLVILPAFEQNELEEESKNIITTGICKTF